MGCHLNYLSIEATLTRFASAEHGLTPADVVRRLAQEE